MIIDVDKTIVLKDRVAQEIEGLQKRRFLGPRTIMRLCLFLMEILVHLRDLSEGLLMLAKRNTPLPELKPEKANEEYP